MTCPACGTKRFMELECVECCIRWLSQMNNAERQLNAPVIEIVAGPEHMEKVRQTWKDRNTSQVSNAVPTRRIA